MRAEILTTAAACRERKFDRDRARALSCQRPSYRKCVTFVLFLPSASSASDKLDILTIELREITRRIIREYLQTNRYLLIQCVTINYICLLNFFFFALKNLRITLVFLLT